MSADGDTHAIISKFANANFVRREAFLHSVGVCFDLAAIAAKIVIAVGTFIFRKQIRNLLRKIIGTPAKIGQGIGSIIGSELARVHDFDDSPIGTGGGGIISGKTVFLEEVQGFTSRKEFRRFKRRKSSKRTCR